jgi:hypothetical protein
VIGEDLDLILESGSDWDVAIRYHEIKLALKNDPKKIERLRAFSAESVLRRARNLVGSLARPSKTQSGRIDEIPAEAHSIEFDLDETIENMNEPGQNGMVYQWQIPQKRSIIIAVDTSLSMTGEKIALTAVALAVVMLQFPEDPIGVIAFETTAVVLKKPTEPLTLLELIQRFLDVPAQGYTHLENGLKEAIRQCKEIAQSSRSMRPATLLISDCKYTAGRDPAYLASRFEILHVLKMGHDQSSRSLAETLTGHGRDELREVGEFEALPRAILDVSKKILRNQPAGRS